MFTGTGIEEGNLDPLWSRCQFDVELAEFERILLVKVEVPESFLDYLSCQLGQYLSLEGFPEVLQRVLLSKTALAGKVFCELAEFKSQE